MAYEDFLQIREDGKPILTKPYTQLSTQQINEYKKHHKLWRKAYRHHKDERKEHISYKTFDYKLIEQDPAILRYFTVVRNRPRNEGFLSDDTRRQVLYAARCWLLFLGKEITNHSITDLINFKKENRNDYSIEDELEQFAITGKISVNKVYASFILGIFKHNRAKLDSHIDNHHRTTTKPLSDGILMKILSELPEREQQLLKYQAYAGQRIKALCAVPLEQIDMTHPKYAIIHIMPHQNKTRQDHNCLVPKELMETILHRCKQLYLPTPFPNYEELWKQITKYVRINYNIRLTSHYLRKRFATI
ncbi:MAG TPA: hypothetical protein VN739_08455, partial [Nitrososphaerales archaeon]|nr:hypothetical protein [Nitrososphaerales archaeon]